MTDDRLAIYIIIVVLLQSASASTMFMSNIMFGLMTGRPPLILNQSTYATQLTTTYIPPTLSHGNAVELQP